MRPFPQTHYPNLEINLDGGLGQGELWNCTAAALKLQKKTLAWSQSDDVTQGLDATHDFAYFGSKMSRRTFFERRRTSGLPAVCEADTK